MARLTPFRALRYAAPPAPDLSLLIAPPYDVIGPEQRRRLAAHPWNIVHVDLPEAVAGGDPYAGAAAILERWIREGVMAPDDADSFYLAEQEFADAGTTHRRRGLIARLRLEPFGDVVIPHERTHDAPRADRTRLLGATGANLSPVFFLHPDPGGKIAVITAEAAGAEPVATAQPAGEGAVRLWRIADPAVIRAIAELFERHWVLIADGHHRYESALAWNEARAGRGGAAADGHVLAFLCSTADPGLRVLPIHRVVESLQGLPPVRVRERLSAWFDLAPVGDAAMLPGAIAADADRGGIFGLLFGGEAGAWIARFRSTGGAGDLEDLPGPLRGLDVVLLHRLMLERAVGLDAGRQARQENLDYVKDTAALLERGRRSGLAVLLNPTPLEQVIAVSRLGLRLPQKSTYFHPKIPTGLVVDRFAATPVTGG